MFGNACSPDFTVQTKLMTKCPVVCCSHNWLGQKSCRSRGDGRNHISLGNNDRGNKPPLFFFPLRHTESEDMRHYHPEVEEGVHWSLVSFTHCLTCRICSFLMKLSLPSPTLCTHFLSLSTIFCLSLSPLPSLARLHFPVPVSPPLALPLSHTVYLSTFTVTAL